MIAAAGAAHRMLVCCLQNNIKHRKEAEAHLQQTAADLKQKEQALANATAAKSAAEGKQAQPSKQLESAQQQQKDQAKTHADLVQQLEQANSRKSAAMEDLAKRKDEVDQLGEQLQAAQQHAESVQADLGKINKQLQVCTPVTQWPPVSKSYGLSEQIACNAPVT